MSTKALAAKFVELCRAGKNFDVMHTMYDPNIVSVEGDGKETSGKEPVIQKSKDWASNLVFHGETVRGPFYMGNADGPNGKFAVYFTLDITRNSTKKRETLEEVALYTVKNDLITREEFYFEGLH